MMIMAVLAAACATLFVGALRTASSTQARLDEINEGRVAVSRVGRTLRTAILPSQLYDTSSTDVAAFISAEPESIRFYANLDNPGNVVGPSRISYELTSDNALVERVQPPLPRAAGDTQFRYCDPAVPSCVVHERVVARNVVPGEPIFTYFDQLGDVLGPGTLGSDDLENVDSIDVRITVREKAASGDGSTYVLRIALPNHDSVIRSKEDS
jgi:hypothetical protein